MIESMIDDRTSHIIRNEDESANAQKQIEHGPCSSMPFSRNSSVKADMQKFLMALVLAVTTVGCSGDGGSKSGAFADPLAQWKAVENERKESSAAWSSIYVDPSSRCTDARELSALRSGLISPSSELRANPGEVFRVYLTLAPFAAEAQWNDRRKTIHFYLVKESITGDQQEIVDHAVDVSNIEQILRADFGRLTTFDSDIQFHKIGLRPFRVSLNATQKIEAVAESDRSIWASALNSEMVFETVRLHEDSAVRRQVCDQLSRLGRFSSLTEYPQISFRRSESEATRIFHVEAQHSRGGRTVNQRVAQIRLRQSGELEIVPFVSVSGRERPDPSQGKLYRLTGIESASALFEDVAIQIVSDGFQLSPAALQGSGSDRAGARSYLLSPISFRFVWFHSTLSVPESAGRDL